MRVNPFSSSRLYRTLLTLMVGCSLMFAVAVSAQVPSYLRTEVPVKDQSQKERNAAAELGLLDVLVRMSGTENVRFDDAILQASSQAINFVEQFQYAELTDQALQAEGYVNIMQMTFSQRILKSLLRDAEHKFWSTNRPTTLVWLVEDHLDYGKQFVQAVNLDAPVVEGLTSAAKYRGLPLSFPLLDFQDQIALSAERVWELDEGAILAASERYSPDVILVGKYTVTSSGQFLSNWQFFHAGENRVYDRRAQEAQSIGEAAISPLANYLAEKYAINLSVGDRRYFALQIKNIQRFSDYKGLLGLLKRQDSVVDVHLDEVSHDELNLRVRSEATVEQFISMLKLDDSLVLEPARDSTLPTWQRLERGSDINPLVYRWAP